MTRTLAPAVMSAWASDSSVASTPWALSILKSVDLYPAAVNAWVRYGASKSTHRCDDVVSGISTPTRPVPAAVVLVSWLMALNDASNEAVVSPAPDPGPDGAAGAAGAGAAALRNTTATNAQTASPVLI